MSSEYESLKNSKISKAFRIREELINFHINPLKAELDELLESKGIFEDNIRQIDEVYSQCNEELQMSHEDRVGKMISRVDLVAEIEEYEELIDNLKYHYSPEDIDFIIKNMNCKDIESIPEYGKMRIYCFLRDICKSLKMKIQKDQDLEASMISENEFKLQTQSLDKLEHLETIIIKRLPIQSQEEIINSIQSIYTLMEISMDVKKQTELIQMKAPKRYKVIRQKVTEIKNEIDKTNRMIIENINSVENFIEPNITALQSTLQELESSRCEINESLFEVSQTIDDLNQQIEEIYVQQQENMNPEISKILRGQVSKEDCEKELEEMSLKIKSLEEEIKYNEVQKKLNINENEKRKAELEKQEIELKSKIDQLNSVKKDEQIEMLEKANDLDSIREEMEKALDEFETVKNKRINAKESLRCAEKVLNQKKGNLSLNKKIVSNRSKQCESTLDFDARYDAENTDPNIESDKNKFYDSSTNVIFQSPVPEDNFSDQELKEIDEPCRQIILNKNECSNAYNNYKRSLSRGGNRSSQVMNPLTESYECNNNNNINLERYNSMGNLALKPKKKKIRNSYRYMNNGNSQNLVKNLRAPIVQSSYAEKNNDFCFEENFNEHQKSTKMLIDCLLKQLNPVTAYISDFNIKGKQKMRNKDLDRSRNENTSSMYLDIQEKMKGSHNNHLTCTSNIRSKTSHMLHFNSKN